MIKTVEKQCVRQKMSEGLLEPEYRLQQLEKQDYATLKAQCLAKGVLFEDDQFPAHNSSYYCKDAKIEFQWRRPGQIKANPQFCSSAITFPARLNVTPGEIGYFWLPGVLMAGLASSRAAFEQTVPPGQSFEVGAYAGIFHFRFCYGGGKWRSVVVDDRLPTIEGQLVMAHEKSGNFFFVSLLEKAYAKLVGCYEACSGSTSGEIFEDFTGGFAETYMLKGRENANMFGVIYKSILHSSLISCNIDQEEKVPYGKQLENGLCMGHFYLLSAVNSIEVENESNQIQLVRLRNTSTNEKVAEWKGSWGCKSREWNMIPEMEKERFGLALDQEGEFWMTYDDFKVNFSRLVITNFNRSTTKYSWEIVKHEGEWEVGVSSGGCSTKGQSFASNPTYNLTISGKDCDPDEGNLATVLVGLMQKNRPAKRNTGLYDLKIGFQIYSTDGKQLTNEFFAKNSPVAGTRCYINYRQVVGRCRLKPGNYVIVPSTFKPNQQGQFLLRLFIERIDWSAMADISYSLKYAPLTEEAGKEKAVHANLFKVPISQISASSSGTSAVALETLLQSSIADAHRISFSLDKCQLMVSLYYSPDDAQHGVEGTLKGEQLTTLLTDLNDFFTIFCKFKRVDSQGLHLSEVQQCFDMLGIYAGNTLIRTIFNRYGTPAKVQQKKEENVMLKKEEVQGSPSSSERCIDFANFAVCALKLRATILLWEKKTHQEQTGTIVRGSKRVVAFGLREFVEQMLRM